MIFRDAEAATSKFHRRSVWSFTFVYCLSKHATKPHFEIQSASLTCLILKAKRNAIRIFLQRSNTTQTLASVVSIYDGFQLSECRTTHLWFDALITNPRLNVNSASAFVSADVVNILYSLCANVFLPRCRLLFLLFVFDMTCSFRSGVPLPGRDGGFIGPIQTVSDKFPETIWSLANSSLLSKYIHILLVNFKYTI